MSAGLGYPVSGLIEEPSEGIQQGSVAVASNIWTATSNNGWAWVASFGGVNFGAAAANRQIIVGVAGNTAGQPNGVIIGGVTATKILGTGGASLWQAAVPTGTSGPVQLQWPSSGNEDTAIQVGQILTNTPTPTGTASLSNGGGGSGPFATTTALTVPTGGVGVAFTFTNNNGSGTAITWSNGVVDYSSVATFGGGIRNQAGMVHYPFAGPVTPAFTVSDGSATATTIVAAAWGP